MEHTLYFLPTDMDLPPETVDALLTRVSPARRAKIAALRFAGDRENALLAAVAVRLCAAEALGAENRQLRFACTEWGKPYLDGALNFCFSAAHTDGAVALAVSPIAVGADAERLREAPHGVAERFFTPEEQAYCTGADDRFFEVWTRREALAKRTGTPLAETFAASRGGKTADSMVTRIFRADDFMLAVASDAAAAFSLCRLNADDLVRAALERLAPLG
mgnify:CR=1 FL=1